MPHPANRLIVDRMVVEGWFRNSQRAVSRSDNWWQVEDAQGRTALLYVVRFMSDSKRGEPKQIPSTPALPRIAELPPEITASLLEVDRQILSIVEELHDMVGDGNGDAV